MSGNGLREIGDPFVVPLPGGVRIRIRLLVSDVDVKVLETIGAYLVGGLASNDHSPSLRALGFDRAWQSRL